MLTGARSTNVYARRPRVWRLSIWSAPAEHSGDGALYVANFMSIQSGVALRLPPHCINPGRACALPAFCDNAVKSNP